MNKKNIIIIIIILTIILLSKNKKELFTEIDGKICNKDSDCSMGDQENIDEDR